MRHLSSDQILDSAEGRGEQLAHLETCPACRTRVEELRQVLALAATDDVPEPSPLFWNHFSERVREAVAAEPVPQPARPRFSFARTASLAAALAIIIIGVAVTLRTAQPVNSVVPAPVGLSDVADVSGNPPLSDEDATWAVIGELASQLNWEDATEAGLTTGPDVAERAIAQMSDEEQREVVELLQSELRKANRL
jgi:hypothetical protein